MKHLSREGNKWADVLERMRQMSVGLLCLSTEAGDGTSTTVAEAHSPSLSQTSSEQVAVKKIGLYVLSNLLE